jgi:hypothetical protein
MTIKAAGLNMTASLKDAALGRLIQLVQENRDDSTPLASVPLGGEGADSGPPETSVRPRPGASPAPGSNNEDGVKEFLRDHGAAELLNRLKLESFPEKILLLAAWHEARGGSIPWRSSDMDEAFKLAKDKPPRNFPRDIRNAIKSGWIHNETPRTYAVTRTGWNRIRRALEGLE